MCSLVHLFDPLKAAFKTDIYETRQAYLNATVIKTQGKICEKIRFG